MMLKLKLGIKVNSKKSKGEQNREGEQRREGEREEHIREK
jgi:hypothetical protein